jgi:hypothetical protein
LTSQISELKVSDRAPKGQRFANRIAVPRSDGRGVSFKSAQLQVDEKA